MAAVIASAQAAAAPSSSVAASPSVVKSCQSSQTVICASSQLCRPGLSGSFLRGSFRIKAGRGYLDTRRRFKGKWSLNAAASAEVEAGEKVLSAEEEYLQAIYGQSQQPESENVDILGGFKDMFKGFTNSGPSAESSLNSDAVKSATGSESAGDAILSAKERLLQTLGGRSQNQPKSEITSIDVLDGPKDAQDAASVSVNKFLKGITESVDAIRDKAVESATEDGLAGKAGTRAKESLDSRFQGITDTVDAVSDSVKGTVIHSSNQDGSSGGAMTSASDSVNEALQSIKNSVDSVGNSIQDSAAKFSAEDGSVGEAVSNAQDSVNKFFQDITDSVQSVGSSVTDSIDKSPVEDGSGGQILSSAKESVDNFANIPQTVEPAGSSVSDSIVNSATEAGSLGESFSSAKESVNKMVQGITDTVDSAGSSDDVIKSASESGLAGEALLSAQEKYLQSIGGGLQQSEDADGDLLSGLKDAQDAVTTSVNSLVRSISGAFDAAENAVKDTYDNFNGSLVKLLKPATRSVEKTASGLRPNIDGVNTPNVSVDVDFTAPFRMGTPANNALKEVVTVLKDVTGKALVTVGDLITQLYSSAKNSLSEDTVTILDDIEDKVSQVAQPFGGAFNQAYAVVIEAEKAAGINPDNPVIPFILVVGGTLFISVSWFQSKYGGYAGDLQPSEALGLLKKEGNVMLVDIRPQESRETEGIPDLRRSIRFKFATVEVLKADKTIRGQLKNANEIDSLLTAAVIRNLKNVDAGTKIIVLDEDGSQSKQIARGLRKGGTKRAYRVEGGYRAWAKEGLRSKIYSPQTPFTILKEETEAIVEELKPTAAGVIAVAAGLVAATYAVLEWEKTLQLIGCIGLAATIYLRVESYESVEDVKADIQLLQKPFSSVVQGILVLTGQAEKGELQLATSPASSAVQGRMLQAAAKHGAASEKEQVELTGNTTEVSEDEMASEPSQTHSGSMNPQEPPL